MPVEKSAGIIPFYKSGAGIEYLVIKNSSNQNWGFPKGVIESGEELEAAARREAEEETGLNGLELLPGFKETIRYFFKAKYQYQFDRGMKPGDNVMKFITYFLARAKTKEIKLSFEHDEFAWLGPEEAIEKLAQKSNKDILKKADDYLQNYFSKKSF